MYLFEYKSFKLKHINYINYGFKLIYYTILNDKIKKNITLIYKCKIQAFVYWKISSANIHDILIWLYYDDTV